VIHHSDVEEKERKFYEAEFRVDAEKIVEEMSDDI
jgi:hypothetical protein